MGNYKIIDGIEWYLDINRKDNPQWRGWIEIDLMKKNGILDVEIADTCRELPYLYAKEKGYIKE